MRDRFDDDSLFIFALRGQGGLCQRFALSLSQMRGDLALVDQHERPTFQTMQLGGVLQMPDSRPDA